ncbi:MAG TPA: hypothetical protein VMR52_14100 [Dehalococcoidia bacterium]|nr:hypothetical protein [Dehalococcoidia bacterium]
MAGTPALVVFYGGAGESEIEQTVDGARLAAAYDAIEAAQAAGIDRAILVTDDSQLRADVAVEVDASQGAFHFGRRLAEVVRRHRLGDVIYFGAGSVPLFSANDFADIAARLSHGVAVTNNHYSSDLIAFRASEPALVAAGEVARDNALARALKDAGVAMESLPRTVATQMDIDAPGDLAVLVLTGGGGLRLRSHLEAAHIDTSRYEATLPLFTDREAEIVVAGRVGSHAWAYLERDTACRVRLFAEERGMEAEGRAEAGLARSLVAFYIEEAGIERFFAALPELGDAAFIDTRVLLAHKRIAASREDRFLSDAGDWERIREPWLREFTQRAAEAAIPVLLSGHSLMSGGLMALNEYAWLRPNGVPESL